MISRPRAPLDPDDERLADDKTGTMRRMSELRDLLLVRATGRKVDGQQEWELA